MEALSREGLRPGWAALLRREAGFTRDWCALFDAAWSRYRARSAALFARCPSEWFPPRRTNVCIATRPAATRPYFQPIEGASWLLEASDFDPACSNAELGAYLFLHAERLALERDVTAAALRNLPYWLDRSEAEVRAFVAACEATPRTDAAGWRALARVLPAVRRCRHPAWHGRSRAAGLRVPGTRLSVAREAEEPVERFARAWQGCAMEVVRRFSDGYRGDPSCEIDALLGGLVQGVPPVLVTSGPDRVLWDPDAPGRVDALRAVLQGAVGPRPVRDIRADLAVVSRRTRDFADVLAAPGDLPPTEGLPLATNGLAYLHPVRGRIVYDLAESQGRRLREPSPPLERRLLGARVLHEWGHAAGEAGWIGVPEGGRAAFESHGEALASALEGVVRDAPRGVREAGRGELEALRAGGSPGRALLARMLARADDYCANLLVAGLAPAVERLTYVRSNVRSLVGAAPARPFTRLARYLHELQYLRFAELDDPLACFLDSTWFREEYLAAGIVDEKGLASLVRAAASLYGCFALDPERFRPGIAVPLAPRSAPVEALRSPSQSGKRITCPG